MPELEHLRLLASALAGRTLDVATVEPGEPSWTDGTTIYVEDATRAEQVQMIAVQASLLAAGSLAPAVLRPLLRRPGQQRRYLATAGHRALVANEEILPSVVRALLDRAPDPDDPPRVYGTIRPRALLKSDERKHAQPSAAQTTTEPRRALAELDEEAADGAELPDFLTSPVGGGGPIGKLLRRFLRPGRARGGGGPPGADAARHVSGQPGAGRRAVVTGTPAGALGEVGGFARAGVAYPEWDVHRRRYRPEWCTVIEADPPVAGTPAATFPDGHALQRPLARLGIGLTRCRRQRQGDDIDIDAAVEARVDTLAGSPHEDDSYLESLRRRRDLAVLVLLDVSGSAGEPGTAGKPVHEHQRAAAGALTAALHRLGDRVALYAFNSRGRQAVQLLRVKTFADRLDGAAARRLAAVTPGAYTRLGAAIRHATTVLDEQGGTPRRLLVVLSDGFAYDHGYEGRYGEADARRALVEARQRGVGCLCLSVGTDTDPAALRRVFGAAAHASVPRVEQLPGIIGPLFRSALGAAEAQRRAFQHTARTRERHELERRTA